MVTSCHPRVIAFYAQFSLPRALHDLTSAAVVLTLAFEEFPADFSAANAKSIKRGAVPRPEEGLGKHFR